MIKKLVIKNFKLFENQSFDFSNLNILTGLNSTGKSTLIQVLLLLRESYLTNELLLTSKANLRLNGDLFKIKREKISRKSKSNLDDTFYFALETTNCAYEWCFDSKNNESGIYLPSIKFSISTEENIAKNTALFTRTLDNRLYFVYLSANRIVPADSYTVDVSNEKNILGNDGLLSLRFLYKYSNNEIIEGLKHPNQEINSLNEQVAAWLGEISPEVKPIIDDKGTTITLKYKYGENEFEPIHVGFGITYTLPIIIALLSAKAGDLIIIENPESHLHPKGQSKLAELMCLAAQNGVQIFCETHSDHIFYGTRVAIKESKIEPENVKTYYFEKEQNETQVHSIQLNKKGRMVGNVPDGFFDQYEINLDKLL